MLDQVNGPSALVIQDDEHVAFLLDYMLAREGFQVIVAADGREAEQYITNYAEPPWVILLDVMLPYVDGFELIKCIRNREHWQDVPIIILSAKGSEQDVVRGLESGANDYVIKPFNPRELLARIKAQHLHFS